MKLVGIVRFCLAGVIKVGRLCDPELDQLPPHFLELPSPPLPNSRCTGNSETTRERETDMHEMQHDHCLPASAVSLIPG